MTIKDQESIKLQEMICKSNDGMEKTYSLHESKNPFRGTHHHKCAEINFIPQLHLVQIKLEDNSILYPFHTIIKMTEI